MAGIEILSAEVLAPVVGRPFILRFSIRNTSGHRLTITGGYGCPGIQYLHAARTGAPAQLHSGGCHIDIEMAPEFEATFDCDSGNMSWFTKSTNDIRPFLFLYLPYSTADGFHGKFQAAKGLWDDDDGVYLVK